MAARLCRLPFIALFVVAAGCPECTPRAVGEGIGRLTVRNVGAALSMTTRDRDCGFASPGVLRNAAIEGTTGGAGSITYTVDACAIDAADGALVSEDCNGVRVRASGSFTISATRTIIGTLTGDPENPIIPGGPDAVTIDIGELRFDNFKVVKSTSENALRIIEGSLSAVARPRLAASASSGLCVVATPNVFFRDIQYQPSTVEVTTESRTFEADVGGSDFFAQAGRRGNEENDIGGTLTVFGRDVDVVGDAVLDEDYARDDFVESYSCLPDITDPPSFTCVDFPDVLATGSARLTIQMLGAIASLVDQDEECGFASPAAEQSAVIDDDGELRLTISDCTLTFPAATALPGACGTSDTIVSGSARVSGTKIVRGRVAGARSVLPTDDQPAVLTLSIAMDGFEVGGSDDGNALLARDGVLSGSVRPRVFVGAETGLCTVSSPNATFSDVTWRDADLVLTSDAGAFTVAVDAAELEAVSGTVGDQTNALSGRVVIDGQGFDVPTDDRGLDPAFDQRAFDASWQCNPELASPLSSECAEATSNVIGTSAASAGMRAIAVATMLANENTECGFASPAVLAEPAVSGGDIGDDDVALTLTLPDAGCTITVPARTVVATDCLGGQTVVGGTFVVRGTKTVRGFLTGDLDEPIVPTSNHPATFDVTMSFREFSVDASGAAVQVHTGEVDAVVAPRTALDPTTGACTIVTPNITFQDVIWRDAELTIVRDASSLDVGLRATDLDAQAGSSGATENALTGTLTRDDGSTLDVDAPLARDFDQREFDASYLCEANGDPQLVSDAACSFRETLGNAAARLLVLAVGSATRAADAACLEPVAEVSGAVGSAGSSTATATACPVSLSTNAIEVVDCLGNVNRSGGAMTFSGTRSETGVVIDAPDGTGLIILPMSADAVRFSSIDAQMTGWRHEIVRRDETRSVLVEGGMTVGEVTPILAQSSDPRGGGTDAYVNETPIARFIDVGLPDGSLLLSLDGKTFRVKVTDVALDALVGAFAGEANDIVGELTVDGELVRIGEGTPFDPAFTQEALDASYSCDRSVILVPPT